MTEPEAQSARFLTHQVVRGLAGTRRYITTSAFEYKLCLMHVVRKLHQTAVCSSQGEAEAEQWVG
jgi:hypothetical protein